MANAFVVGKRNTEWQTHSWLGNSDRETLDSSPTMPADPSNPRNSFACHPPPFRRPPVSMNASLQYRWAYAGWMSGWGTQRISPRGGSTLCCWARTASRHSLLFGNSLYTVSRICPREKLASATRTPCLPSRPICQKRSCRENARHNKEDDDEEEEEAALVWQACSGRSATT